MWGFLGGIIYAAPRLASAIWGSANRTKTNIAIASVEFIMSMVSAPAFAVAFSPTLLNMVGGHATPASVQLVLGLWATRLAKALATEKIISGFVSRITGMAPDRTGSE